MQLNIGRTHSKCKNILPGYNYNSLQVFTNMI